MGASGIGWAGGGVGVGEGARPVIEGDSGDNVEPDTGAWGGTGDDGAGVAVGAGGTAMEGVGTAVAGAEV